MLVLVKKGTSRRTHREVTYLSQLEYESAVHGHQDVEKRWSEIVPKLQTQVSGRMLELSILTAKGETGEYWYCS